MASMYELTGGGQMTIQKTPDLSKWKKLGPMTTDLGIEFHL